MILVRLEAIAAADANAYSIPFLGMIVTALTLKGLMNRAIAANDRLHHDFPYLHQSLHSQH